MNWVFGAYANVYHTAMMQEQKAQHALPARRAGKLARLFGRA
ncbi:MAG TPA: hypothetical protein PKE19_11260 [Aestuariivirga sp.]|jgi:hypothetical protein|nr:hypothetical protein [Aestuariivirga sp.]